MKSFDQFFNEGITPEPPGGWQMNPPAMEKWLSQKYQIINDDWVIVKRALLTGEIPDHIIFPGKPAERKMSIIDIAPSKGRKSGMVDWIRTNIKEVIVVAGRWADNDTETNERLIFSSPVGKEEYQEALSRFRKHLVGFGNSPQTMWHIIDMNNAREIAPSISNAIDELFDLTREIVHYNREQTPEDRNPNPGHQPPGGPLDH